MITINPENPSSDDNVEFTFYLSCPFYENSKTIVGSQFIINAGSPEPVPPCVSTSPPMPFTWSVGRLQVGEYQAILNHPYREQEIQAFSVFQGEQPFPAPSIPSLGFTGAILLAIGLAWIANKAFKTDAQKRAA